MTRSELERRLVILQAHYAFEKIEIFEQHSSNFYVALTLTPNVPISERLILRLEEALGEPVRSLAFLRSGANVTLVRFTVPRSATDDQSEADRVQETAASFYGGVGTGFEHFVYKKYRLARTASQTL